MANAEDDENVIPGYGLMEPNVLGQPEAIEKTPEEWRAEFVESQNQLATFLRVRDPFAVLAKTSMRHMIESLDEGASAGPDKLPPLEQGEIELIQAFLLTQKSRVRFVPTSPNNFIRFWPMLGRHVQSFIRMQPDVTPGNPALEALVRRARLLTIHYRNHFERGDCERTLLDLLSRLDDLSEAELGYKLSDAYRTLIRILNIVNERLQEFVERLGALWNTKDRETLLETIKFFSDATPLSNRLWQRSGYHFTQTEELRAAAFQMSEMANTWIYKLPRSLLAAEFDAAMLGVIDQLSIKRGALSGINLEHIYMNNPVWKKPYIALDDGAIFAALPQMPISFPFSIIEGLIQGNVKIGKAYEDARAKYLESSTATLLRRAMPNATVYEKVFWTDPITNKTYENDVVVVIGNTIFLFEAKGGRIADAARRGGTLSLERNFRELFVEPGEQAWRLQNYLDSYGVQASLTLENGDAIDLHLERKKVIYKFSICIEHFSSLTSAKRSAVDLGLVKDTTAWAPVLSWGELQIIERFLDSEISFFHYLTRRATIEDQMNFDGDEQDLLSMYLTNGFCVDAEAMKDRTITFLNADGPVRVQKVPRQNRTNFKVYGIELPPIWLDILREVYRDDTNRHRFDLLQAILNQSPAALIQSERFIRRCRLGESNGGSDVIIARYAIGKQLYAVVTMLLKRTTLVEDPHVQARYVAQSIAQEFGATDCAVFMHRRKSKERPFDGVSFFRLRPPPAEILQSEVKKRIRFD